MNIKSTVIRIFKIHYMKQESLNYANFGQRLLAFLIDFLVLFIVTSLVWLIFILPIPDRNILYEYKFIVLFINPFGSLFGWLYYAIMECSRYRGTIGKIALGIAVVDDNGERISFGNATGRFFGKFLSSFLLGFGYLMILFTKKNQALHDILASTYIIRGGSTISEPNIEAKMDPTNVKTQHTQEQQLVPNFEYERNILSDSYFHKLLTEEEYNIKLQEISKRENEIIEKKKEEKKLQEDENFEKYFNNELNNKIKPLVSKLNELKRLNLLTADEVKSKTEIIINECKTELGKIITYESYRKTKLPHQSQPTKPESHGIARLEL